MLYDTDQETGSCLGHAWMEGNKYKNGLPSYRSRRVKGSVDFIKNVGPVSLHIPFNKF